MSTLSIFSDASERWHLIEADATATMRLIPEDTVDAIVCDPPYGIALGNSAWDRFAGSGQSAAEAFQHWTRAWALEALRVLKPGGHLVAFGAPRTFHRLTSGIEDAGFEARDLLLWLFAQGLPKSQRLPDGLGTTLKPAFEPIALARKPLAGQTRENLSRYGTGALNIDASRIGEQRYWPAHLTLSHAADCGTRCAADCPAGMIDAARPDLLPSRLFFCAKTTRTEREAGCEQLPKRAVALYTGKRRSPRLVRNLHPTVKPVSLMRHLVKLITPPGGLVLDLFAGSASTGIGAVLEGRTFLGIEREGEYVDIACARLHHWAATAAQEEVLP